MQTMWAGHMVGPRRLELIQAPMPEVGEGQILVKVEAGCLCGSDMPFFLHDLRHPALHLFPPPLEPLFSLHELVGRVAVSKCTEFREGDRVLSLPYDQKGLGEYFLSEAAMTVPVPEGPVEELVLAQPLGTVIHACLKLPNVLGQTVVILGQGPIGQLFTALLRRMGVLRVIAVDLLPERLEVSRQMGATHVVCGDAEVAVEAVRDITGGAMADFAVEAVGEQETVDEAATLVKRNGIVLVFGVPHTTRYDLNFMEIFRRELRLISSVGPNIQHEFPIAVEMIASGALNVKPLVTHQLPYTQAQEAYSLFADRRDGVIKAILRCEG